MVVVVEAEDLLLVTVTLEKVTPFEQIKSKLSSKFSLGIGSFTSSDELRLDQVHIILQ